MWHDSTSNVERHSTCAWNEPNRITNLKRCRHQTQQSTQDNVGDIDIYGQATISKEMLSSSHFLQSFHNRTTKSMRLLIRSHFSHLFLNSLNSCYLLWNSIFLFFPLPSSTSTCRLYVMLLHFHYSRMVFMKFHKLISWYSCLCADINELFSEKFLCVVCRSCYSFTMCVSHAHRILFSWRAFLDLVTTLICSYTDQFTHIRLLMYLCYVNWNL